MNKLYIFLMTAVVALSFAACSKDNPSGDTIFPTDSPQRDNFEQWLLKNYTYPYNVDFQYRMQDIETDKKYTLVPADSAKCAKLAIIIKHLWFDAYNEVIGPDFIKNNVPRILTLVGSPAYNSEGTMVLGTAEGGYKVTLYMVNWLTDENLSDYNMMTDYYFNTMHHEFQHILNQKKPYDTSFDLISEGDYVSGDWYLQSTEKVAQPKGFIRNYAMSEPREDYAETYCQYITNPDDVWEAKMINAGAEGRAIIMQKVEYIRTYMMDSWGVDIDKLHKAVIRRGQEMSSLDLEHLN
ncbi:MAG: putative zinc-binding metallopeptidase [Prevotella sp.]|nr:putative zinc-binding metallopeptidase [Prevotella sp.]